MKFPKNRMLKISNKLVYTIKFQEIREVEEFVLIVMPIYQAETCKQIIDNLDSQLHRKYTKELNLELLK